MSRKKNKVYGFATEKVETVGNQNQVPEETTPEAEVTKPGFSPKEFISKGATKAKGFAKKAWDNRGKIAFVAGAVTTVAAGMLLNKKNPDPGTSDEEPENADEVLEEDFESEIEEEVTPDDEEV